MPTINQLVRFGRDKKEKSSKSKALQACPQRHIQYTADSNLSHLRCLNNRGQYIFAAFHLHHHSEYFLRTDSSCTFL